MRRIVIAIAGAAAAALMPLVPAYADSTVTVRGAAFPTDPAAQLSFVGCADPFVRGEDHLQPYVGLGPGDAPAGVRSLGYDLVGGNAIGSLHYLDSVAATTVAGMSVAAPEGAAGVSYVGYQEPADRGTGPTWIGRAELTVPAGGWHTVDVTGLVFTWQRYDTLRQRAVGTSVTSARIAAFVRARGGDGPGFVTVGFGCDGRAFSMDAWRIGRPGAVTTYDFEGLATTTAIDGPDAPVDAGGEATLRGRVATSAGVVLPHARLVLEQREADGSWTIVAGVDGADVTHAVRPESTTTYRWHFVDRPLAEGSVSAPFTVRVRAG